MPALVEALLFIAGFGILPAAAATWAFLAGGKSKALEGNQQGLGRIRAHERAEAEIEADVAWRNMLLATDEEELDLLEDLFQSDYYLFSEDEKQGNEELTEEFDDTFFDDLCDDISPDPYHHYVTYTGAKNTFRDSSKSKSRTKTKRNTLDWDSHEKIWEEANRKAADEAERFLDIQKAKAEAEYAKIKEYVDFGNDRWPSSSNAFYKSVKVTGDNAHSQRSAAKPAATQESNSRLWDRLFAQHDEAIETWADYELNLELALKYPLVTDVSNPLVMSMLEAMNRASMLRPESGSEHASPADSAYATAVVEFTSRLNAVIHAAKKAAWSSFTTAERKRLDKAAQMLRLAQNAGASPHERQAAYKRLLIEVEGLIVLPETPLAELEESVRKEITATR